MIIFLIIMCFLIGAVFFAASIFNFYIYAGFSKGKTGKTKGYLEKVEHHRNIYVGGKSGRWFPHWVDFVYSYHVNGISYSISSGFGGVPNNLSKTVDVIYQKNHPKHAYAKKITFPMELILGISFAIPALFFLVCAVGILLQQIS